jgi:hypothetical protein
VKLIRDTADSELYFEFRDTPYMLKDRLRYEHNLRSDPESFVTGKNRFANAILMNKRMLKELYTELLKHYNPIPIEGYEPASHTETAKARTKDGRKEVSWTVHELFDMGEIVLYREDDDFGNYCLGYHPDSVEHAKQALKSSTCKVWNGCYDACLSAEQAAKLLWVIGNIIANDTDSHQ